MAWVLVDCHIDSKGARHEGAKKKVSEEPELHRAQRRCGFGVGHKSSTPSAPRVLSIYTRDSGPSGDSERPQTRLHGLTGMSSGGGIVGLRELVDVFANV